MKKICRILKMTAKNKGIFITNILGLSFGLTATILLMVFILYEWSYDRCFSRADDIYRLHSIWIEEGTSVSPINLRQAYTMIPNVVPGVESAVQIFRGGDCEIKINRSRFAKNKLLYVDSTFFDVFDLKIEEGSMQYALDNIENVVITKKLAKKIFGDNNAVGQTIKVGNNILGEKEYTVSAVTENAPINIHFDYDLLIPMRGFNYYENLGGLEFFTYYLFKSNVNRKLVCNAICKENTKLLESGFKGNKRRFSSEIKPLKKLHLFPSSEHDLKPQGSIQNVIVAAIVAGLIMFLSLTNFVNLFIISAEQRSKEIAVRKVNGAGRIDVIKQFFLEAASVVSIAFIIGIALSILIFPSFGNVMQRQYSTELFKSPVILFALFILFIVTVFIAASYPAFFLSKYNPAKIMKSKNGKTGRRKIVLSFVGGAQLVITLFLVIFFLGINNQIHFLKNLSPGFNVERVVNITNLNDVIVKEFPAIQTELLKHPAIEEVSASWHPIGRGASGQCIRKIGDVQENRSSIKEYRVQPGLCNLLQLKLKKGRLFNPQREADRMCLVINEKAEKMLGFDSAVGQKVVMAGRILEIIGVVENFRYESAANVVKPLAIAAYSDKFRNIVVRLSQDVEKHEVMMDISKILRSFDEGYILNFRNVKDIYKDYYGKEERLSKLISMGALLALVIVMMGIYMVVTKTVTEKTKEIGIRKVMGGSIGEMLMLVYSNSLKEMVIAIVMALPISFFLLNKWMLNYYVKAPIELWLFFKGIAAVIAVEIIISMGNTLKIATKNPVDSLRYE